jgi:predicted phosphodiesterase
MKIAIVSDTHGNVANFKKAVDWLNKERVQMILHCGDIGNPESLRESLEDFSGEFFGVLGNMDIDFEILIEEYNKIPRVKIEDKILEIPKPIDGAGTPAAKSRLGAEIENKFIAITHRPEDAKILAQSGKYDLVFYGHTHKPWEEKIPARNALHSNAGGGYCRMINPGELAGQFYKPTFAIYDTDTDKLELKILEKL